MDETPTSEGLTLRQSRQGDPALRDSPSDLLVALNNAVTVVLARAHLLCRGLDETHALQLDAEELHQASQRVADLLSRFLTTVAPEGDEPIARG